MDDCIEEVLCKIETAKLEQNIKREYAAKLKKSINKCETELQQLEEHRLNLEKQTQIKIRRLCEKEVVLESLKIREKVLRERNKQLAEQNQKLDEQKKELKRELTQEVDKFCASVSKFCDNYGLGTTLTRKRPPSPNVTFGIDLPSLLSGNKSNGNSPNNDQPKQGEVDGNENNENYSWEDDVLDDADEEFLKIAFDVGF